MGGSVLALWGRQFLDQPSKVLSTEASSRARATPAEGERGKPTLVEAKHQEGKEGRRLTGRRGFSCPQAKAAPATQMEGGEGKLLARMSLAQGSLAASLVVNNNNTNGFNSNFQNQGFNNQNQGFSNPGFNNQN